MCLAVSGRILAIDAGPADDPLWRQAEVDFGGVRQQVSLACLPEARVGDRVLVHVGLALSLVEEEPAQAPSQETDRTSDWTADGTPDQEAAITDPAQTQTQAMASAAAEPPAAPSAAVVPEADA